MDWEVLIWSPIRPLKPDCPLTEERHQMWCLVPEPELVPVRAIPNRLWKDPEQEAEPGPVRVQALVLVPVPEFPSRL